MPQLNPSPWLAIFIFSWLILLIIIPPKILAHLNPNEPSLQDSQQPKTSSWTWPWH
uniref:ATP synthase complex subunit 8 n=1 Tax=Arcos sp. KU 149 TaxID=1312387 RepID=Q8HKS0_9TELE|nr:ATP synthase F0 subunit 8 [Arcos sp. KU 149]BAC23778.1 ATPase subunit 8 [Arcos sp. KU 149]